MELYVNGRCKQQFLTVKTKNDIKPVIAMMERYLVGKAYVKVYEAYERTASGLYSLQCVGELWKENGRTIWGASADRERWSRS